jgi:putative DNA primase/helicase
MITGHILPKKTNLEDLTARISVSEFLAAFYSDTQEKIHLRSFKPKSAPDKPENRPASYTTTRAQLTFSASAKQELEKINRTRGIYFVVNAGGDKDKDITRYNAFFVESDSRSIEEQHAALDAAPLVPSIRVETKKSVHAYWLIDGDCTEAAWRDMQERLISCFDGDKSIKNPSRTMRLPFFNHVSYSIEKGYSYKPVEVVHFEPSRRYTVADMKEAYPVPKRKETPTAISAVASSSQLQFQNWEELNAELKRRVMQAGKLNARGNYETKGICHNGKSDTAIMFSPATGAVKCMAGCTHERLLEAFNLPKKPMTPHLIIGGHYLQGDGRTIDKDAAEILVKAPTTDAGNAECMSALYKNNIRYCHTRKKWLLWDGVCWRVDGLGNVQHLTVKMARARQQVAMELVNNDSRTSLIRWGLNSEAVFRVKAALEAAQWLSPFATSIEQYDANLFLAATQNGTIDLGECKFRDSLPDDYMTLHLGTLYDPDASCPRWEEFLNQVFGGDKELIDYIQRAVGYSLTGDTSEQVVFLCHGNGANGKSVLLGLLEKLLGDYAGKASFDTFDAGNRNNASNDLAALKGKRLVTVIEAEEDKVLAEAKIKAVTGQDLITCRFLFREFFTYKPEFKIWMAMNHLPIIRGGDRGIWRRIRVIPFFQSFEGREDRGLPAKLEAELSGILNWALEGLRKWWESGLGEMPETMKKVTEEYRHDNDSIGRWLEERTIPNPLGLMRAGVGYQNYSDWMKEVGELPFSQKNWGKSLRERGYQKSRDRGGYYYLGLELVA